MPKEPREKKLRDARFTANCHTSSTKKKKSKGSMLFNMRTMSFDRATKRKRAGSSGFFGNEDDEDSDAQSEVSEESAGAEEMAIEQVCGRVVH